MKRELDPLSTTSGNEHEVAALVVLHVPEGSLAKGQLRLSS